MGPKTSEDARTGRSKSDLRDTIEEEKIRQFAETIDSWKYNPKFELTPETLAILRKFYYELEESSEGGVSRSHLSQAVQKLDQHNQIESKDLKLLEHGYNGEIDPEEAIDFEAFCELVMLWKQRSPGNLEIVYNGWLNRLVVDFTDLEGSFLPTVEDPYIRPSQAESRDYKRKSSVHSKKEETNFNIENQNGQKSKRKPEIEEEKGAETGNTWQTNAKSFVAGGLAGVISRSALAPMDRVKIIFQVTENKFTYNKAAQLGKDIFRKDGFTALFRGNSANLLRAAPYAGIQHSSFDFFRRQMITFNEKHYNDRQLSSQQMILAGSLAGTLSLVCTYPLDVLRARMIVQYGKKMRYSGVIDAAKSMYKAEGFHSFTRGMAPSLLGAIPYTGIGFALNENIKQSVLEFQNGIGGESEKKEQLSVFTRFFCSYVAACMAQSITYPLDTIRRRMQTHGYITGANAPLKSPEYGGIIKTGEWIFKHEGVRGFYKGLSMNWLRSPISVGISLTTYDVLKEVLGIQRVH